MSLTVLRAGFLTTVQDRGRHGWRHLGIGSAGALDAWSAQVANLLVGNAAHAALLEITLAGPVLRFRRAARIAVTGAELDATLDGIALPAWRTIELPAGAELRLGACRRGSRAYLAIGGGIEVACVLGSRATDLRAGFGGFDGRALRNGDELLLGQDASPITADAIPLRIARAWIDASQDLDLAHDAVARVLPGSDATEPAGALSLQPWRVDPRSDRQGLRLDGVPIALQDRRERVSEPVAPGTIQLPPDGRPIVLLADAQTCGGYPCIGHVASADLPRLAQCRPGDSLRFAPCTVPQAQALRRAQQQRLYRIGIALAAARPPRDRIIASP